MFNHQTHKMSHIPLNVVQGGIIAVDLAASQILTF